MYGVWCLRPVVALWSNSVRPRGRTLNTLNLIRKKVFGVPTLNPTTLRKAKIVYNFGLSECNRVNHILEYPT